MVFRVHYISVPQSSSVLKPMRQLFWPSTPTHHQTGSTNNDWIGEYIHVLPLTLFDIINVTNSLSFPALVPIHVPAFG